MRLVCSLVTKRYNEWYCFANTQQLVKLVQFRREKREGLPDGVAVLKVEQLGQLGGGGRAEGTVNEEADVLMGVGGTWTHLKCFHAKYSTM